MHFKERLRARRTEKQLTQKQLGRMVGLEESTISKYESKDREPDFETLKKFASILDCSTDYLLGISDSPKTRLLEIEELKEFLPEPYIENHPLKITVEGDELSPELKDEIVKYLKEKGHLKKYLKE